MSEKLVRSNIKYIPNMVHPLNIKGNLSLHRAAASGNIMIIHEFGHWFTGTVLMQNHNNLLPLHLTIMACVSFPTTIVYEL